MEMRKKDFISGIVLIITGLAFFAASMGLPWRESGYELYGAPGIMPAILSILLVLTGALLAFRRKRPDQPDEHEIITDQSNEEAIETPNFPAYINTEAKRAILTVALCCVYVFGLLGKVPYFAATAIFVAAFIFVFKGAGLVKSAVVACAASGAIWAVFYKIFAVFLP